MANEDEVKVDILPAPQGTYGVYQNRDKTSPGKIVPVWAFRVETGYVQPIIGKLPGHYESWVFALGGSFEEGDSEEEYPFSIVGTLEECRVFLNKHNIREIR